MGTSPVAAPTGPRVDAAGIIFALPDPARSLQGVALYQEIVRPRPGPRFAFTGNGAWTLRLSRPDADRFEYQFVLTHKDGKTEVVCDPSNPRRAPGPFGDKSVLEFEGYRAPEWLDRRSPPGVRLEGRVASRILRSSLPLVLWSTPGASPRARLPLLIVHDGPEYELYSGLTHLLDDASARGLLPTMRAALIGPVDRNQIYSASAAYTRAFVHELLPAVADLAPVSTAPSGRLGMGASLGALAMLHIHRHAPEVFGALYLQSGSFFRQRYDAQESGFVRFRRVSRFAGEVLAARDWRRPIDVTMTCGTAEENLANNIAMRDALRIQGYLVEWVPHRDAHNWVSWRDTLDPHLIGLLARSWA